MNVQANPTKKLIRMAPKCKQRLAYASGG